MLECTLLRFVVRRPDANQLYDETSAECLFDKARAIAGEVLSHASGNVD